MTRKTHQIFFVLIITLITAVTPQFAQSSTAQQATRSDDAILLSEPPGRASDQNPAFSPDGTMLFFTRFENGYNEGPSTIYLLELESGDISVLTTETDSDSVNLPGSNSWNERTNRITFSSDREDIDEIWTIAPDGSHLFRVTHHTTAAYFLEPSFSPDGQWIVFEVNPYAPEGEQQGSIWKIRSDGSESIQLTDGWAIGTDDRQPNWSPTGERILFQRRESGSDNWDIFTMSPDGTDIRQVTNSPYGDTDASFSPDGNWIVYSSDQGGLETASIFIISIEGGVAIRATFDERRYDGAVSWSPDGQWLVFESYLGDEDAPSDLWLIAAPDLPDE